MMDMARCYCEREWDDEEVTFHIRIVIDHNELTQFNDVVGFFSGLLSAMADFLEETASSQTDTSRPTTYHADRRQR